MHPDTNAILHFDNLELDTHIRALIHNDEPLFVAKDVCENLELGNSRQAIASLDEDEKVTLTSSNVINRDIRLPNRGLQFVTESGLYALIFKSQKQAARKFRKWVTGEVLPSIRRHGRYDPVELAATMAPSVRRAYLMAEVDELERRLTQLRRQADLAEVIPGQLTVWQWLLLQGESPKGGHCGVLSGQCKRLCDQRGIPTGVAKEVDHCGQITRLSRTARTFPEAILREVCGEAA